MSVRDESCVMSVGGFCVWLSAEGCHVQEKPRDLVLDRKSRKKICHEKFFSQPRGERGGGSRLLPSPFTLHT